MKKVIDSIDEIFSENNREQILEKVKSFYENKLAEKDNQITFLENTTSSEIVLRDELIEKLRKNQLFKEYFYYQKICNDCDLSDNFKLNINYNSYCQNCSGDSFDLKEFTEIICFKDNSKYDKLPSKDVK